MCEEKNLEKMWDIIRESKRCSEYLSPMEQQYNLTKQLNNLPKEDVDEIAKIWTHTKLEIIKNKEKCDELWKNVFPYADDTFGDCIDWLIAQGRELYNDFLKNGYIAIVQYINKYNIKEEEYSFENMFYAFYNTF